MIDDGIQRGAWPQRRSDALGIRVVVATDVDRLALHRVQFRHDLLLICREFRSNRCKVRSEGCVLGLPSNRLCSVQRQVEVAATVVKITNLAGWSLVVAQVLAGGGIKRFCKNGCTRVAGALRHVLKACGQRHEFTE